MVALLKLRTNLSDTLVPLHGGGGGSGGSGTGGSNRYCGVLRVVLGRGVRVGARGWDGGGGVMSRGGDVIVLGVNRDGGGGGGGVGRGGNSSGRSFDRQTFLHYFVIIGIALWKW